MQPVYVATNPHEKAMQRALIQYKNPKNYDLVYEALMKAGRQDLIGYDKKCLIRPRRSRPQAYQDSKSGQNGKPTPGRKTNSGAKSNPERKINADRKANPDRKTTKKTIRNVHKKKQKS
jgi:hypothetical protein